MTSNYLNAPSGGGTVEENVNTGELDSKFEEQKEFLRNLIKEFVTPLNALNLGVIIVLFGVIVSILLQSYTLVVDSNDKKAAAEAQMTATMLQLQNTLNQSKYK